MFTPLPFVRPQKYNRPYNCGKNNQHRRGAHLREKLIPGLNFSGEDMYFPSSGATKRTLLAPAGSLIVINGLMWHGVTDNVAGASRRSALYQYVPGYFMPKNSYRNIPPEIRDELPARVKNLLGWYKLMTGEWKHVTEFSNEFQWEPNASGGFKIKRMGPYEHFYVDVNQEEEKSLRVTSA